MCLLITEHCVEELHYGLDKLAIRDVNFEDLRRVSEIVVESWKTAYRQSLVYLQRKWCQKITP